MHQMVMHFGGVIVAPGYTDGLKFVDGNPYGVSHITGPENQNELDEATINALAHMTRRVVEIGGKLAS